MFRKLIQKLKNDPKTIVFTEGTDPRILEASARLLSGTFLTPILIGDREEVLEAADRECLNMRDVQVYDPLTYGAVSAMTVVVIDFTCLVYKIPAMYIIYKTDRKSVV